MTKYEQKLRDRAEEFAQLDYPEAFKDSPCYDTVDAFYQLEQDTVIEQYKEMARLSLQREAEAYKMGFNDGDYYGYFAGDEQKTSEYLQSLGLVP